MVCADTGNTAAAKPVPSAALMKVRRLKGTCGARLSTSGFSMRALLVERWRQQDTPHACPVADPNMRTRNHARTCGQRHAAQSVQLDPRQRGAPQPVRERVEHHARIA